MVDLVVGIVVLVAYVLVRVLGADSNSAVKEAKTIMSLMKNK